MQDLPSDLYPVKLLFVYDKTNVSRKYECPSVFRDDGVKDPRFVQNPWGNGVPLTVSAHKYTRKRKQLAYSAHAT